MKKWRKKEAAIVFVAASWNVNNYLNAGGDEIADPSGRWYDAPDYNGLD